jgi:hypothetical protein
MPSPRRRPVSPTRGGRSAGFSALTPRHCTIVVRRPLGAAVPACSPSRLAPVTKISPAVSWVSPSHPIPGRDPRRLPVSCLCLRRIAGHLWLLDHSRVRYLTHSLPLPLQLSAAVHPLAGVCPYAVEVLAAPCGRAVGRGVAMVALLITATDASSARPGFRRA